MTRVDEFYTRFVYAFDEMGSGLKGNRLETEIKELDRFCKGK